MARLVVTIRCDNVVIRLDVRIVRFVIDGVRFVIDGVGFDIVTSKLCFVEVFGLVFVFGVCVADQLDCLTVDELEVSWVRLSLLVRSQRL